MLYLFNINVPRFHYSTKVTNTSDRYLKQKIRVLVYFLLNLENDIKHVPTTRKNISVSSAAENDVPTNVLSSTGSAFA